jgi:hypothetical protein
VDLNHPAALILRKLLVLQFAKLTQLAKKRNSFLHFSYISESMSADNVTVADPAVIACIRRELHRSASLLRAKKAPCARTAIRERRKIPTKLAALAMTELAAQAVSPMKGLGETVLVLDD